MLPCMLGSMSNVTTQEQYDPETQHTGQHLYHDIRGVCGVPDLGERNATSYICSFHASAVTDVLPSYVLAYFL